jgi:regulatory protein
MAFARPKKREPVGEAELFEYAVGSLARKMRTVRDLKRLMRPRAFEGAQGEADMEAVVVRLVELKYLSDTRFAQDYTRMRKENQGFGRRRVQQDLAMKGVDKELVQETLAAAYDETDEVALARQYCERRRIQRPEDQKTTVRVMNRLMRAGYGSNAIFKLLRAWKVEVPEADAEEDEGLPEF